MGEVKENRSVSFLRGVPADEALAALAPAVSKGYGDAIEKYGTALLQYGHFNGFEPLREVLADLHRVRPDRIIAGNGGMEVISLLFKSLPKGSTVLVEEITYDRVIFDALQYGHRLVGIRLSPDGIDLDQLKEAVADESVSAFYGIPFHHNPTGITYPEENRRAAEEICRARDVLCIWDICYEPLRYDGEVNTPVSVSDWGPVLVSSFTKTISPGTKCGYAVVPEHLLPRMTRVVANTRLNPNLPTQGVIADFIRSGACRRYLSDLCALYTPRMAALNRAMKDHFPGGFSGEVTGGFFSCIRLKTIGPEKEQAFLDAARAAGVGITPAWDAVSPDVRAASKESGLLIRLTFPACTPEDIAWGMGRLKEVEQAIA